MLLYLTIFWSYGQNKPYKTLKGKVQHATYDVVGVVVQNSTTQQSVITNKNGYFSIPVQLRDTLVFTAIHFKQKTLPVDKMLYDTTLVTVFLEEFVNELNEVVVQPYNLSGDLTQDLKNMTLTPKINATTLALPNATVKIISQSERKLQEASGMRITAGAGAAVALNPLINAITGRTRRLKKHLTLEQTYARTQQIQHFYTDTLLITALKIPEAYLEDFMYFCEVDRQFQILATSHDKLKLWGFMQKKSRLYRNSKGLE